MRRFRSFVTTCAALVAVFGGTSLLIGAQAQLAAVMIGSRTTTIEPTVLASNFDQICEDIVVPAGGWCETFDTATAVNNFRYNFGAAGDAGVAGWDFDSSTAKSELVSWDAATRRLVLDDNPDGDNPTSWWRNFNPAVTTMSHSDASAVQEYSAQVEVEVSSARYNFNMGGSGHKTIDFTLASQNGSAQVLQLSYSYANRWWEIANTGAGLYTGDGVTPPYYVLQPGSEYGTCTYQAAVDDTPFGGVQTPGCYNVLPDERVVLNFHFNIGADGQPTTQLRASACIDGEDVTIFERTNVTMSSYTSNIRGHSAINLINRNEDHDPFDENDPPLRNYYDNVAWMPGADSIPCPEEVAPSAPSWFTGETENRWAAIPGTDAGDLFAANSGLPGNVEAYSGMAVDDDDIYFSPGGHALMSNNSVYRLPLLAETTAWERVMLGNTGGAPCTGGSADCTTNGTGAYNDGSRASDHEYGTHVGVGGDCQYFGIMGSAYLPSAPGTFVSSAVWKWCLADLTNGEYGYTYLGKALGTTSGTTTVESSAVWDQANGRVYVIALEGTAWYINTASNAITTFTPYSGQGGGRYMAFAQIIPRLNVLLIGTDGNTIETMPLSSPGTWTTRTTTGGTFSNSRKYPMVYSPAADQLIGRLAGDGAALRCVTLPSSVSGSYSEATCATAGGGVNPGDPDESDAGPYTRFNIVTDFGGTGCDMILYWPDPDEAVFFRKVCGPI